MIAGEHSLNWTHVLYHVGVTALFLAAVYAVILILFRPLLRKGGRAGRPSKWRAGGRRRQPAAAPPGAGDGEARGMNDHARRRSKKEGEDS